ncbi:hypothetical protein [Brunnivagina elsteri]|uniref:Uncharacterized protein n=1 Tax=Brunnivagina elsteri CCALA 953 TaxID=987040 RepID=A0A2A2TN05_9CYAN|nr:hypothetical protein [Calothrix elsteri]PAX59805.1 hypothetical protein CK510_05375 [Calothrix elsteri CCALA 953]
MFQQYRYISARTLLEMPKLARCQSLPQNTWTPAENLWHLVFISHRWGNHNDPDSSGLQLAALKLMVQRMADIAEVISDERVGVDAAQSRLARVPSLNRQGTLQAAHLVFRSLCEAESVPDAKAIGDDGRGILDLIGFWYDYSCLPQDPKTPSEADEFAQTLQGIGDMILSSRVSTLILRKEGDGYVSRGWCFAESMIAQSKDDTNKPLVLWTDRWDEPVSLLDSEPFSVFKQDAEKLMAQWEDSSSTMSACESFCCVVQATALPLLLKSKAYESEFALAQADTTTIGIHLLAHIHPWLAILQEGEHLDLSVHLATLLQSEGLGCRDNRDYILVSLLLLKSLTSKDAAGDVAIWGEALVRFTEGLPLYLIRHDGKLEWQEKNRDSDKSQNL